MPNTIVDFSRLFSGLSYDRIVDIKDQWLPPKPTFTEANLSREDGRVFIITGGNSGIGLALIKLLYPTGAKIYLACRSEERAKLAIQEVIDEYEAGTMSGDDTQTGPGELIYMHLDLNDLRTIKASAAYFAQREPRLDIIWNNAGVAGLPTGTKTMQNVEAHIGINCVGPLLFTQELLPQLRAAAEASSTPGATRVIWSSSMIIERFAPHGGIDFAELDRMNAAGTGSENASVDYAMSKTGNWFLAVEGARRWGSDGIVSVTQNPGMINTTVWKHQPNWLMAAMQPTFYPAKMGAYTMLFAGLSNDVGLETNGVYILPFGRVQGKSVRDDILKAIEEGKAKEFWGWCEEIYQPHA